MKNILKKRISAFAFMLMGFAVVNSSCTANFEEINNAKENISREQLGRDNYNVGSFLIDLQNNAFPEQENKYQMCYDLIGNYLGRYMTYANNGFSNSNFARFNAPNGWAQWPFTQRLADLEKAYNSLKLASEEGDLAFQWGVVLRISGILDTSDQYGALPIGLNKQDLTAYSSQKEIYEYAFKALDTAKNIIKSYIESQKTTIFLAEYDHVYNGDFSKWLKYINSLKLRMAIRVRFVEPELAKKYAEEAVADGVMTENSDNLCITYTPNAIYKTSVEWGDSRACADIDSYMNGYNDPRITKYFKPTTIPFSRLVVGCLSGAEVGNKDIADKVYSAANVKLDDRGIWMSAAEMYFCRAEGAILGWSMGESAQTLYNKGIETSFEQWGVSGADEYKNNDYSTPNDYVDALGGYGQGMAAASGITVKWNDGDIENKKLERIIVQKWIAMFPAGQQAWNEIRRTGYPKIFPITTSTNGYNLLVPNRIPYPTNEKVINAKNYEQALKMNGGEDNYSTKMWWQK